MEKEKNKIRTEIFCCKRGGLTIRGRLYRPGKEAAETKKLPIAIFSHGFMANQGMMKGYAKAAAALGYAALTYDFCGGCLVGKSDGKTADMSVLTEVEDLLAVFAWAKDQDFADPERIVLVGASQGGFVSALTAARLGDEIKKLVLFYPALCIPDDARKGRMMFAKFDPANIPPVVKCGPMKLGHVYPEAVLSMDPFQEIAPYQGPVLILHGMEDQIVDISYARRAAACYQDCRLVEIPGAGHGFRKKDDAQALPHMLEFLLPEQI